MEILVENGSGLDDFSTDRRIELCGGARLICAIVRNTGCYVQ